jgi:DNA (cytosine-5)-methyltransferase 1
MPQAQMLSLAGLYTGEPDRYAACHTEQLSTAVVGNFFRNKESVVVLEPFGGLCAGLEMALRSGIGIHQYHYLDIDPVARSIAAHRIDHLRSLYPTLLSPAAVQGAFSLPQDIRQLTTQQLVEAGATTQQHPWLVVAGWPCQELSMAGKGAGLRGERSSLLHELVRVIGTLQQLQPDIPPA